MLNWPVAAWSPFARTSTTFKVCSSNIEPGTQAKRTMPSINVALSAFRLAACAMLALGGLSACVTKEEAKKLVEALEASGPNRPDSLPVPLNREAAVRYPPALFSKKAQGDVTLRIFIDTAGRVHPESTVVVQTSGEPAFDSAAVAGMPANAA